MSYILAFLAGVISILSPCILPLIPILITSGFQASRYGVLGLPLGMGLSFSIIGTALAYSGHFLGFDSSALNIFSSILLITFGLILCIDKLQLLWIKFSQSLTTKVNAKANQINAKDFKGQFLIGLLLGIAWTPCIGPTLGAAITLAAKGQQFFHVVLTMVLFAIGATLPVVLMTFLSKKTIFKYKPQLQKSGRLGKRILGILLIIWGVGLIFAFDKYISAWLLLYLPSWMFGYI